MAEKEDHQTEKKKVGFTYQIEQTRVLSQLQNPLDLLMPAYR